MLAALVIPCLPVILHRIYAEQKKTTQESHDFVRCQWVSFEFLVHGGLGVFLRLSILCCCICSQAIEDLIIHKRTKQI